MSRNIIVRDDTGGSGTSKSDLTVPSENQDVRVVAETERRAPPKRKFNTKGKANMAKESKASNARPARKVKLNRSIFNANFEEKFSFRVKTLGELKHDKQAGQETLGMSTQANVNTASTSATLEVAVLPTAVDTRTVLKLNPAKNLMLPTIQLTRLNSGKYARSITKRLSPTKSRKIMSEARLRRFKALKSVKANEIENGETNKPRLQGSPTKKCRISPIRSPEIKPSPEYQSPESTTWPETVVPLPEVKLEKPHSPALSLGAQSDPELEGQAAEPESDPDARLVINAADGNERPPLLKSPPVQRSYQLPSNVDLDSTSVNDDKLDVMSIMADDDELFVDERQRPVLKRSLSQDSVFGNTADQDDGGDLRSLLVKSKDDGSNVKKSVGDLIVSRPVSKSYKIPHVNQSEGKPSVGNMVNKSHQRQSGFSLGHYQQKGAIGPHGGKKGVTQYQEAGMVSEIRLNLKRDRVLEAWTLIKKLDEAKCSVDIRILEEVLKVCESVSRKTSKVGDVALGAFEMIQRLQGNCKTTDFVMVIFTLCRCNRGEEGFKKYLAMKSAQKLPQDDALEHFINNWCKCLVFIPSQLIEFLEDVTTFPLHQWRKIAIVNNCVASLISSNPKKLRQVAPEKWNSLLTTLCSSPGSYIQSALQVHSIMEKNGVVLSATAVFLLFKLTQETGVTQTVLKLICSKATRSVLVARKPPVHVAQILLSPEVKVREVEQYFLSLFNKGIMPEEDILYHFITKASLAKEYMAIYQLFLKCRKVALTLPPPVLKQMMEVLENWDENKSASVEVYAALRLAKKAPRKPVSPEIERREVPIKNSERFATGGVQSKRDPCHRFFHYGYCQHGDKCKYSHNKKKDHQLSSCVSEHPGQESVGKGQTQGLNANKTPDKNCAHDPLVNGMLPRQPVPTKQWDSRMRFGNCRKDDRSVSSHSQISNGPQFFGNRSENCQQERFGAIPSSDLCRKPDQKSTCGSGDAPALDNSGTSVVHKTMMNGLSQNPPLRLPFPAFQVLAHRLNNPQLFRKFQGDRPPFKPQFQRNMPSFHMPEQNCVPKWNHFQAHGVGKQLPHESVKQHPGIPMVQHSPSAVTEKPKVGRSFSWEPRSNVKPSLHNGKKVNQRTQVNPGIDKNNNSGNGLAEFQHRVEMAVKCKEWKTVYACYIKCKGANVKSKDLLMFRNGFVKNTSGFGQNFSAFVEFLYEENCSGGSCHSSQSVLDVFDQYDIDFIGALGVSLMEKCLVSKQFDEGYEVLLRLHSHNISYFQNGKNFGAYTQDIPSQNVALIAVKLCLGIGRHGGLSAMEVLRACNYALVEEGELTIPQDKEYRIKVLHQLYVHLFEEGQVLECFEVLQNLNAGANIVDPMYTQVLHHFVAADDFEQSFAVLDKMHEKQMDLNRPPCHLLYEKFLKHCITTHEYDEAANTLKGMESRGISIDGGVLRNILSMLSSTDQDPLANLVFKTCIDLKIYPETFRQGALWLCELGCGYSQQELKLLICKHLEQLHCHLLSKFTTNQLVTAVKDFQIVLLPRLPGFDNGLNITDGIKAPLENSSRALAGVLQQDFNPPLVILEQSGEQFHQKILVEKMSVYRWFIANMPASPQLVDGQGEYDTLSEGSVASDCSAD